MEKGCRAKKHELGVRWHQAGALAVWAELYDVQTGVAFDLGIGHTLKVEQEHRGFATNWATVGFIPKHVEVVHDATTEPEAG